MGASRKRGADEKDAPAPEQDPRAGGFAASGLSWREWLTAGGDLEARGPGFSDDAVTDDSSAVG